MPGDRDHSTCIGETRGTQHHFRRTRWNCWLCVSVRTDYQLPSRGNATNLQLVDSKQKPPSISAVWCPWCHVGLRWAYGETEVRKITGRGAPIFSACWFRSMAPGFRNWHLPVHMGLLAHPRPCHRLAVPAAPHGPCTQQFALFFRCPETMPRFIYAKSTDRVIAQQLRRRNRKR